MKKRLIGTLLMGAFTLASTSMFVSCKDYDDDINNLQQQITANDGEIAALKTTISTLEGTVNSLKTQLEAKDGQLEAAIAKAQKAAEDAAAAAASAGTVAAEAKAAADKANQQLVTIAAEISSLTTRIKNAEDAITDLRTLLNAKVDKTAFDAEVRNIYARIEAVETGLGQHLTKIQALEGGLADEKLARETAVRDLQQQIQALEAFKAQMEALELVTKTDLAAALENIPTNTSVAEAIDGLKTELQAKIDQMATAQSVEEVKQAMEQMDNKITAINAELSTLNVLLVKTLRSLVFIPDFYYFGIEATKAKGIYTNYWLESDLPTIVEVTSTGIDHIEKAGDGRTKFGADVNDHTWSYGRDEACWPYTREAQKVEFLVETFVSRYHLNPQTADLSKADYNVLQADREYVTRSYLGEYTQDHYNTNISVAKDEDGKKQVSIVNGDLYVNMVLADPTIVKNIGHIELDDNNTGLQRHFVSDYTNNREDQMVTVYATEVTIDPDAETVQTVTSDYAALRAQSVYANGYRLAHTKTGDPAVNTVPAGLRTGGSYTGVQNPTGCGVCFHPGQVAGVDNDNCHLFTDADETVYEGSRYQQIALTNQPYVFAMENAGQTRDDVASKTTAQDVVYWNGQIDLTKLVELHRVGNVGEMESVVTEDELKANGLEIQFELTGILMAQNVTSESAHAAIKKDETTGHYLLRPQLPIMTYNEQGQNIGYAAVWGATAQSRTTIGRTPLVRVKLVDTKNDNRIYDYGFIRLVIIDDYRVDPDPEHYDLGVIYDAGMKLDYEYWNYACSQAAIGGQNWKQKWGSFENDVYKHPMNQQLTQVEFELKYDSVRIMDDANINIDDYIYATVDGGALRQYLVKCDATTGLPLLDEQGRGQILRECTAAEHIGKISAEMGSNIGDGTKTQVLRWDITGTQLRDFALDQYLNKSATRANKNYENDGYLAAEKKNRWVRAVKYQVLDQYRNELHDIYVILYTDFMRVYPNNEKPELHANFDVNKIAEYWYKENTQVTAYNHRAEADYWREAHLNVPSPEDWVETWRDENKTTKPFEFLLASDFNEGTKPNFIWPDEFKTQAEFEKYLTITDPTPNKDFATFVYNSNRMNPRGVNERVKGWAHQHDVWHQNPWYEVRATEANAHPYDEYYFEFHKSNDGKQFKGFSGKTYTISRGTKTTVVDLNGTTAEMENWALLATNGTVTDTVAYLQYKELYATAKETQSINNIKIVLKKKLGPNAEPNRGLLARTGTDLTNSFAEDLLNYCRHNQLDDNDLKALLGIRVRLNCTVLDVPETIQVRFLRPINIESEDKAVQDAANTTQEIPLWDIIKLTDWREQWNPAGGEENTINKPRRPDTEYPFVQVGNKYIVDYWYYYNIRYILVGNSVDVIEVDDNDARLNGMLHTNMNQAAGLAVAQWPLLSTISENVEFFYKQPAMVEDVLDADGNIIGTRPSQLGDPHYYGSIIYRNNRSTVDNFDVTVPVTVVYEWGTIYDTNIQIHVKKTLENTDARRY